MHRCSKALLALYRRFHGYSNCFGVFESGQVARDLSSFAIVTSLDVDITHLITSILGGLPDAGRAITAIFIPGPELVHDASQEVEARD